MCVKWLQAHTNIVTRSCFGSVLRGNIQRGGGGGGEGDGNRKTETKKRRQDVHSNSVKTCRRFANPAAPLQ